jgi:hypothetical protein
MKKNYFLTLLIALFVSSISFGQALLSENFNSGGSGNYFIHLKDNTTNFRARVTTTKGKNVSESVVSVEKNSIEGFSSYPNPVNNGRLTITTSSASEKEVTFFNVLGKRVFSQKFSGTNQQLDVSQIKSGIYIMKVIEGEKMATKKLVIK